MTEPDAPRLNPGKLLLSKWTAVNAPDKERHFLVARVINPETAPHRIEWVELEAVLTRRRLKLPWTALKNTQQWRQGWVTAV